MNYKLYRMSFLLIGDWLDEFLIFLSIFYQSICFLVIFALIINRLSMKTKSFILFFLCLFLVTACSEDEINPEFSIETTGNVMLASEGNSKATITFTSALEWQANCSADWVDISPASGKAGAATITVTAEENSTTTSRNATIILISGSLQEKIQLTQEAGEMDVIELEQANYDMPVEGGVLEIIFSTNMSSDDFSIFASRVDWLTQDTKTRVVSKYVLKLNVLENSDKGSRNAEINFVRNVDSKILATVKITQKGTSSSSSTDYSADKSVRTLQTASVGKGIPIVIMGDGFIDTEIADGTYEKVMQQALENIFSEEPIKSLRDYFNVYAVTAVSKNNAFGSGYETAFSCVLEGGGSTGISGDDQTIQKYVQYVKGIDINKTLVVVILNTTVHAGTTSWYMREDLSDGVELAIAYCPIIRSLESENFRQVLTHEAVGHGFAKLEDEYAYTEQGVMPYEEISSVLKMQSWGWAQNVDFTSDPSKVLWSSFLSDNRYTTEGLGVFEGACTFIKGAYRPSEDSMMSSNTVGFNAPSRKEIYDKVMERGVGVTPAYEEFVTFDMAHKPTTRSVSSFTIISGKPFARPRLHKKAF